MRHSITLASGKLTKSLPAVLVLYLVAILAEPLPGQSKQSPGPTEEEIPVCKDYRGISIGMTASEARKKLGNPKDKSDGQDFFIFDDKEMVQIVYDTNSKVTVISVDFLDGAASVPTAKLVFGSDVESRPDGSMYKMVRYPKAGYWVSFSRTSGDKPLTTITMQKIEK